MKNKKILIVGGGIAGCTLAINLLKRGVEVHLVDRGENYSTNIAAGMVNPIVFRRMNLSWRVEYFFTRAKSFYQYLEQTLKIDLVHDITIRRLFSNKEELDLWNKRIQLPEFQPFLNPITKEDIQYKSSLNKFGTGRVNAFWVDSKKFYKNAHAYIKQKGELKYEEVDFKKINFEDVSFNSVKYDSIVFCLGFENNQLNTFNDVPIQQTKGQLLTIESVKIPESESLNRKCFLIPKGNHQFIAGATYEWNNATLHTDEKAQVELKEKLKFVTTEEYTCIQQEAGIRPTMLDRRPVIGNHSTYKNICIFNGLGTKGYLIAPGLSEELTDSILNGNNIPMEYNVARIYSKKNTL